MARTLIIEIWIYTLFARFVAILTPFSHTARSAPTPDLDTLFPCFFSLEHLVRPPMEVTPPPARPVSNCEISPLKKKNPAYATLGALKKKILAYAALGALKKKNPAYATVGALKKKKSCVRHCWCIEKKKILRTPLLVH